MNISELICKLQEVQDTYGDVQVIKYEHEKGDELQLALYADSDSSRSMLRCLSLEAPAS